LLRVSQAVNAEGVEKPGVEKASCCWCCCCCWLALPPLLLLLLLLAQMEQWTRWACTTALAMRVRSAGERLVAPRA